MLNRAWTTSRRQDVLPNLGAITAAALVTVVLAACSVAGPAEPVRHPVKNVVAGEPPVNWSQPLRDAHRVTFTGAEKAVGLAVPMPNVTSLIRVGATPPNRIRLTPGPVWVSGKEAALTFNGGTVTILVGRATYKNAGLAFRTELAAIKVGRAAIEPVNGKPALIIQPRTDYTKSNPALVEFYLHGLDINVISTRFGTKLLRVIAESVKG